MAIIILFSSIFAALFFLLGLVFKGMATLTGSITYAIKTVGSLFLTGAGITICAYLVYLAVDCITNNGFLSTAFLYYVISVVAVFVLAIPLSLGKLILRLFTYCLERISDFILYITDELGIWCTNNSNYFLNVIIVQINKIGEVRTRE